MWQLGLIASGQLFNSIKVGVDKTILKTIVTTDALFTMDYYVIKKITKPLSFGDLYNGDLWWP